MQPVLLDSQVGGCVPSQAAHMEDDLPDSHNSTGPLQMSLVWLNRNPVTSSNKHITLYYRPPAHMDDDSAEFYISTSTPPSLQMPSVCDQLGIRLPPKNTHKGSTQSKLFRSSSFSWIWVVGSLPGHGQLLIWGMTWSRPIIQPLFKCPWCDQPGIQ